MENEMKEMINKLSKRYDLHVQLLDEAKKHTDFYVVAPVDEEGEASVSMFVETQQGGGYRVTSNDEPYHYILPTAMDVARKMRKATGRNFTWVKLTEWHERVIDLLLPYRLMH